MSGPETRTAILQSAARLFASKGYAAISIRDVAADVGVTPANLYYHFKDKEQLVRATLVHVFAERTSPMDALLAEPSTSDHKLQVVVGWFVGLIFTDEVFSRLLFRELLDGDKERLEYLSKTVFERPFGLFTSLTTDFAPKADPVLLAVSIVGVVLGHFQLSGALPHLPGGKAEHADPAVITRHVLALLRYALKAEPHDQTP